MFGALKGFPWELQPSEAEILVKPFPVDVPIVDVPVITEPESRPFKPRRVYVTPEILEKFGVKPSQVIDVTGCGDTILAGLCIYYSKYGKSQIRILEREMDTSIKLLLSKVDHDNEYEIE